MGSGFLINWRNFPRLPDNRALDDSRTGRLSGVAALVE